MNSKIANSRGIIVSKIKYFIIVQLNEMSMPQMKYKQHVHDDDQIHQEHARTKYLHNKHILNKNFNI